MEYPCAFAYLAEDLGKMGDAIFILGENAAGIFFLVHSMVIFTAIFSGPLKGKLCNLVKRWPVWHGIIACKPLDTTSISTRLP